MSGGWSSLGVVLYGLVVAVTTSVTLQRQLLLTTTMLTCFALAYAPGMGSALEFGARQHLPFTSSEDCAYALALNVLFLVLMAATSALVCRGATRKEVTRLPANSRASWVAFFCLFGFVAVRAFATGYWTYYGSRQATQLGQVGGFRPELLYAGLLFVAFALVASSWGWGVRKSVALSALGGLVFLLQSRRVMIAAIIVLLLMAIRDRRHKLLAVIPALAVLGFFGTWAWRTAIAEQGYANNVVEQVSNTYAKTQSESPNRPSLNEVSERLTYFWVDSLSVKSGVARESILDFLRYAVVTAVPGAIFPSKYREKITVCDTLLATDQDLPCTPVTEGYLSGGVWGVIAIALIWGVGIAVSERLLAYPSVTQRALGLALFSECIILEGGAFPFISALRMVVTVAAIVVPAALIGAQVARSRTVPA